MKSEAAAARVRNQHIHAEGLFLQIQMAINSDLASSCDKLLLRNADNDASYSPNQIQSDIECSAQPPHPASTAVVQTPLYCYAPVSHSNCNQSQLISLHQVSRSAHRTRHAANYLGTLVAAFYAGSGFHSLSGSRPRASPSGHAVLEPQLPREGPSTTLVVTVCLLRLRCLRRLLRRQNFKQPCSVGAVRRRGEALVDIFSLSSLLLGAIKWSAARKGSALTASRLQGKWEH